jgi:hypothetical protein
MWQPRPSATRGFLSYNYPDAQLCATERGMKMPDNQTLEKWKQSLPDIYFDRFQLTTTVIGVNMVLSISDPAASPLEEGDGKVQLSATDVAVIRTSPTHAKLISMIIRKQLKKYEDDSKTEIQIPEEVYAQLKLNSSDW